MLFISLHPINAMSKYILLTCLLKICAFNKLKINCPILCVLVFMINDDNQISTLKIIGSPPNPLWILGKRKWQETLSERHKCTHKPLVLPSLLTYIYEPDSFFSRWQHAVCRIFCKPVLPKNFQYAILRDWKVDIFIFVIEKKSDILSTKVLFFV